MMRGVGRLAGQLGKRRFGAVERGTSLASDLFGELNGGSRKRRQLNPPRSRKRTRYSNASQGRPRPKRRALNPDTPPAFEGMDYQFNPGVPRGANKRRRPAGEDQDFFARYGGYGYRMPGTRRTRAPRAQPEPMDEDYMPPRHVDGGNDAQYDNYEEPEPYRYKDPSTWKGVKYQVKRHMYQGGSKAYKDLARPALKKGAKTLAGKAGQWLERKAAPWVLKQGVKQLPKLAELLL